MDVQVQVAGQITSKPTSNGGTKFDIPLSNGMRASTFDALLATKVSQFGQQSFTARIEQKPNPRGGAAYTNINAAAGPGEQLPPEIPQAGTPIGAPIGQAFQQFPQQQAAPFVPQGASGATPIVPAAQNGGMPVEREIKIVKQSMLAAAANLVGNVYSSAGPEALAEAEEHVSRIAKGWFKAVFDNGQAEPPAEPVPFEGGVATDPQAVAAYVADQAGAPVVQVGAEGVQSAVAGAPAALPWS